MTLFKNSGLLGLDGAHLGIGVQARSGLGQEVRVCMVGSGAQGHLLPQIGGQVGVRLGDGSIGGLGEVAEGSSGATGRGVAILNTGHGQQLLGHGGRDDAGTTGGGDEAHGDGTALAGDLAGHGVGLADLVAPVATAHGHHGQLGQDDGAADGGGHFLAALNTQTNVAVVVADGHEGLETGTLTSTRLLLHGHDLQHLVLQRGSQEEVDDLELFDGKGVQVDLLQRLDLALAHQAT